MFDKILIANRGEIACRVIRTCRRLGIGAVAVHSDADADALHVRMADQAVRIGPANAAESYLKIERIIDAARATGADAIHPGYGFLSENAPFAEALAAAGITFIGPPISAIRTMGDKIESKRLAVGAGVATVPGHTETIGDPTAARRIAAEIGYPVMIKAAAGGGGKGMRVALDDRDLQDSLARAQSEARSAFGDDRVFLERYIRQPRHIEIQVLGDRHGTMLYLGERECSIQRRHQKVIEEAPSPFLDAATRRSMGEQAVALAKAVGYHSAGTVEFIVDRERNFYFLEMNTRLQVEHPVTELVTGLDLVEQMIRIAAGEKLTFGQDDIRLDGWAIEARLYAEDPARGFLPSIGRVKRYLEPFGEGIRVDSGVVEGSEIALFYDPMLAKVCAHGSDRRSAIARLAAALDAFYIRGPNHNLAFLAALLHHLRFQAGELSTDFIAAEFGDRFEGIPPPSAMRGAFAAIAVALRLIEEERAAEISGRLPGWQPQLARAWIVRLGDEDIAVHADRQIDEQGEQFVVEVAAGHGDAAAKEVVLRLDWRPGQPLARACVDGQTAVVQVDPCTEGYRLTHGGIELQALVRSREAAEYAARMPPKLRPDLSRFLLSPMPGLIVSIAVQPGDEVKAGQELAVLEAMKMENVLRAEHDGRIEAIGIAVGATVAADQVLITFASSA